MECKLEFSYKYYSLIVMPFFLPLLGLGLIGAAGVSAAVGLGVGAAYYYGRPMWYPYSAPCYPYYYAPYYRAFPVYSWPVYYC